VPLRKVSDPEEVLVYMLSGHLRYHLGKSRFAITHRLINLFAV
jgi:hypothetical protein